MDLDFAKRPDKWYMIRFNLYFEIRMEKVSELQNTAQQISESSDKIEIIYVKRI